jgi:hypothetical protein
MIRPFFTRPGLHSDLKIDQIAFLARTDGDVDAIKGMWGLQDAEWIEDIAVTVGSFNLGNGVQLSNVETKAHLRFCYHYGIEFEILRYLEGMNYPDEMAIPSLHMCHVGMHIDGDIAEAEQIFDASIYADMYTVSHTNPYLLERGRKYNYKIYDTRKTMGVPMKTIRRIEE